MKNAEEIAAQMDKTEELPDRGRDDLKLTKAHTMALLAIAYQLARLREDGGSL